MSEVTDALREWKGKAITRQQLLRQLLQYENWMMPMNEGDDIDPFGPFTLALPKLIPDESGRQRVLLFDDREAQENFEAAQGGCGFANPTGWEIFSVPLDGVDSVVIDAGAPHEFVVESSEFAELQELAAAIRIDEVWQRLRSGDDEEEDEARAAHYPGYYLVGVQEAQGVVLINVPNDDGLRYTPIFTHADALALAMNEIGENFPSEEIKTIKVDGAKLFPALAQEKTDGFVFNYKGPGQPMAFRHGITEVMLAQLAKDSGEEPKSAS